MSSCSTRCSSDWVGRSRDCRTVRVARTARTTYHFSRTMTCYGGSGARTSTSSMPTKTFSFLIFPLFLSLRALSVSHMISISHSHSLPVRINIDCSTRGLSPRLLTSSFNLPVCTLIFYRFFWRCPHLRSCAPPLLSPFFFLLSSTVRTINFTLPPTFVL